MMDDRERSTYCNDTADLYQCLVQWWKGGQIGSGEVPPATIIPNALDAIMLKLLGYTSPDELIKVELQSRMDHITNILKRLKSPNGLTVFKAIIIQRENEKA